MRSPGVAGAEDVRPMDGGAAGCGEVTVLAFGEADLSQDEKKSSSSAGWAEALEVSTRRRRRCHSRTKLAEFIQLTEVSMEVMRPTGPRLL